MISKAELGLALDFFHGDARRLRNSNHVVPDLLFELTTPVSFKPLSFQVRTIWCCLSPVKRKATTAFESRPHKHILHEVLRFGIFIFFYFWTLKASSFPKYGREGNIYKRNPPLSFLY
jgi:hypothetical protein